MDTDATVFAGQSRALSATAAGLDYGDVDAWLVVFADDTWRWGLPPRGIPSDLAADRLAIPDRWGTLSRSVTEVTLHRDGNVELTLTEDGGRLTDAASGDAWVSVAALADASTLIGAYARADWTDSAAPRLELGLDGRFTARGRITGMCGSLHNVVERAGTPEPDRWSDDAVFGPGAGTWTAELFTLRLVFDDGRVLQYALVVAPTGQSILLGETVLARIT